MADQAVSALMFSPLDQAKELHAHSHNSVSSLCKLLRDLTKVFCKHHLHSCASSGPTLPLAPLEPTGVHPRVLLPTSLWHIDVTHVPSFRHENYVPEIIETPPSFLH